jgi:hypothetical protein
VRQDGLGEQAGQGSARVSARRQWADAGGTRQAAALSCFFPCKPVGVVRDASAAALKIALL